MEYTYKIATYQSAARQCTALKRLPDGAFIPEDPDNTDYQEYLAWVADGNVPDEEE